MKDDLNIFKSPNFRRLRVLHTSQFISHTSRQQDYGLMLIGLDHLPRSFRDVKNAWVVNARLVAFMWPQALRDRFLGNKGAIFMQHQQKLKEQRSIVKCNPMILDQDA